MEVFATAHDALFAQAGLAHGERLLVNGAAGGVGVAGVQLGVAVRRDGSPPRRGTARSALESLGADTTVEGEYDVILELVGGDNFAADLDRLAVGGRMVVIGTGAGSRATIDFGALMRKRGPDSRLEAAARSLEEKALVVQRLGRHVLPLVVAGRVRVPVERTFPLDGGRRAYDAFAAGGKFGKLVLVP